MQILCGTKHSSLTQFYTASAEIRRCKVSRESRMVIISAVFGGKQSREIGPRLLGYWCLMKNIKSTLLFNIHICFVKKNNTDLSSKTSPADVTFDPMDDFETSQTESQVMDLTLDVEPLRIRDNVNTGKSDTPNTKSRLRQRQTEVTPEVSCCLRPLTFFGIPC